MTGEPRLIQTFDSVDSTNDRALALAAAGAPDGSVIVAAEQTAGRGRRGRTWHSPEGGLYLSYLVREVASLPRPAMVTMAAGVATAGAIREVTGFDVRLKWPNDVIAPASAAKIAGILAEASSVGSRLEFVILGIGINISLASIPRELQSIAASLEGELGRAVERAALQDTLVARLDAEIARLRAGLHTEMLHDWSALSPGARDRAVSWCAGDDVRSGVTAGIDENGALLVRTADGLERLVAGEVVWA